MDTRRSRGRDPRGEDGGREGRGERRKEERKRKKQSEKDHGVGGQGDDWEEEKRREENSQREVGRWEKMHTHQLGRKTEMGLRPARVTETERRSWAGKGASRDLSPEKKGGQMGRLLAPHGPE